MTARLFSLFIGKEKENISPSADITYTSLAKSFGQPLAHHAETMARMRATFAHFGRGDHAQEEATLRMALFPVDAEVLFVAPEMWVVSLPARSQTTQEKRNGSLHNISRW